MKNKIYILLLLLSSTTLSASDRIGLVKNFTSQSILFRSTNTYQVELNTILTLNDTLKTDSEGSIGAIFSDGGILTLGPSSEVVITRYEFDPIEKKVSFKSKLLRGSLAYEGGAINRILPGSVTFDTPQGMLHLHGTKIVIKVDQGYFNMNYGVINPFNAKSPNGE